MINATPRALSFFNFLLLFLITTSASAATPNIMGYNGYITNSEGDPVDSNVDMAFRICDSLTGGSCYFLQTFEENLVTNGYFEVLLDGAQNELFDNMSLAEIFGVSGSLFIEIQIEENILAPRQRIGAVPYALSSTIQWQNIEGLPAGLDAEDAVTLASLQASEECGDGQVVQKTEDGWQCTGISELALSWTDISDRPQGLDSGSILASIQDSCQNKVPTFNGTSWECVTIEGGTGPEGPKGEDGQSCAVFSENSIFTMVCTDNEVSWTDGDQGAKGEKGDKGDRGDPFNVHATGTNRASYDDETSGFSFLNIEEGNLYIKASNNAGDWSNPIPFGKGDTGNVGETGATPNYQWSGTRLRFDDGAGTWGSYVDLRGIQGPSGANGTDGTDGADGADGTSGEVGPAGSNSLVLTSNEPAGSNCPNGGVKIDVGVDTDGNNQLTDNENPRTTYVCNGLDMVKGLVLKLTRSANGQGLNCSIETGDISDAECSFFPADANFGERRVDQVLIRYDGIDTRKTLFSLTPMCDPLEFNGLAQVCEDWSNAYQLYSDTIPPEYLMIGLNSNMFAYLVEYNASFRINVTAKFLR